MPFAGQPNPCSLNSKMCISVSSNLLPFNDSKSGLCIYFVSRSKLFQLGKLQRFPSRLKVQNSFGGMKTDNLELKPLQPKDAAQLFLYRDLAKKAQMTYVAL